MADGRLAPASLPRSADHQSWRPKAPAEGPKYRWQQQARQAAGALVRGRSGRWVYTAMMFTLAGGLLAWLIAELLYAPALTPLAAIAPTGYDWPIAPSAWTTEDMAHLKELGQKTIRFVDLTSDWRSAERGLARFDEALQEMARRRGRAKTVVLYINMPGAIDGQGRACLIPPGASPQDSGAWLPLATILTHIKGAGLPSSVHKLLVLDVNRAPVNWNIGQLAGGFIAAVPHELDEAKMPSLAVLTSSDSGETAAASPALRGTIFGHYLRLGLAGAADASDFGGDENNIVSLQELRNYLVRHVYGWSMNHLGTPQTPRVFPATANFGVTWSLQRGLWRDMVDRAHRTTPAAPAISAQQISGLWRKLFDLRAARLWRYDPLAWRELEHRFLWLERLAAAGKAYEERSSALYSQLADELQKTEELYAAARQAPSLPAYVGVTASAARLPQLSMHSLPLAAFWGTLKPDALRTIEQELARCQAEPSRANLAQTLAALEQAQLPPAFEETNFLAICRRLHAAQAWPGAQPLSDVLAVRQLAERLAAPPSSGQQPGDERSAWWVRGPLEPLDRSRRELEDAVLLGPRRGVSVPPADDTLDRLQNLTIGERAARAFELRDELWADLPYLAAWLSRAQFDADRQDAADKQIRQTLLPLIAAAIDLEQQLVRQDGGGESAANWTADSALSLVEGKLTELRALVQQQVDAALIAAENPELMRDSMREIEALLAQPILPWDIRDQLVRERVQLHLKLAARYDGAFDGAPQPPLPETPATPHLQRILRWPRHPLAEILGAQLTADNRTADTTAEDDLAACGALGQKCRQRLAALGSTDLTRTGSEVAARLAGETPVTAGLGRLSAAESQIRRAAALWFPRPGVDPVAQLRRADLQALFLWSCRRALDDFSGPAKSGNEPLFAVAAADYLAAARAIGPLSTAAERQATELASLLARRRIAARDALAVSASDILLVDRAASVSTTLKVTARTPEAAADLPAATAATFLADDTSRVGPAGAPLAVPPHQASEAAPLLESQTTLETAELKNRGPALTAITTIRGNDFTAPVLLRAPGGALAAFQAPVYGEPTVTVLGFERKRASVEFILDCSHSMQEPATAEGPDGTGRMPATRMEVAKQALSMMLGELADRGTLRVGVRLFGHRVGWSTIVADKLLRQTAFAGEIPATLRPYADVEQILPLGRFDASAAAQVSDKLQTVKAWGESPLYLAMREAVDDFGSDDNAARSIVVITDGRNNQFNPPAEFKPDLNSVLTAAQRAKIAIHIVGFEVPPAEAQSAGREFSEIATRSGGSYVPAAGATALLDTLQRLLRPGEFRVVSGTGATVGQAPLGQPVTILQPRGRRRYSVTYQQRQEPIELAGGEAVELAVRAGEPRLEVVPYLKGSPRFQPLVDRDTGRTTELQAGIHRSVRGTGGVEFPISIQHRDGHFVPRPVEMWVEVTPLGLRAEESSGPYIFYDAPLAGGTSVPLANFLARGWPSRAAKAEVRVWMKTLASPTTEERPLAEVADRLPDGGQGFTVAGASGVTYQVRTTGGSGEGLVIGLIERHERPEGVGSLKVALSPQPKEATHQFDPHNRLVLHTFTYDSGTDRGQVTIQFTTRDSALAHSLRTPQPEIVDVSDRSDLLELTPTAAR
jgi:hypothetical protein